ncbi:nitronate monooxygenase [Shewanella sp. D64]|uniref:NAD(P)H-dependent flavin oxidoreductase n=1 Tax=unclassified Shewanella TaxID=196818 RepID=UPI0022BA5D68|nr:MULTISPECIES: nitronate monooxygenase [unclassified Shewanella]MEC4724714.1 nitronate monooxygenase [Shewanella sp. D64]MEC4736492.1 nitronate monooxygenase [Shewanella sp. E94]WBJ97453.1 nitronate monooxygenase [Shewanella sp. MTB7]
MLPIQWQERLSIPVVMAPMFLVSGPELVIAGCKKGVVGTFPALNQRSSEDFERWLQQITAALADFELTTGNKPAPYGVNLIVHDSNPRLKADLALCVKYKVPLVITALGALKDVVDCVHGYGGVVFHDVTTKRHALKAAQVGVDGIIAVSGGAGGHAGTINPFSLVEAIRQFWDKTLLLGGCINRGEQVRAAELMGADLAYVGTRFINTLQSRAPQDHKQMIIDSASTDVIHTPAVTGVHSNFMKQSLAIAGYDMQALLDPGNVNFGAKLTPTGSDSSKAWQDVWSAGHGVAGILDIPDCGALIDQMIEEYTVTFKQKNCY